VVGSTSASTRRPITSALQSGATEDESTPSAGSHTRCFELKHRRNLLTPLPAAILGLDKVVVAFMT
jgi:hypothetical protein